MPCLFDKSIDLVFTNGLPVSVVCGEPSIFYSSGFGSACCCSLSVTYLMLGALFIICAGVGYSALSANQAFSSFYDIIFTIAFPVLKLKGFEISIFVQQRINLIDLIKENEHVRKLWKCVKGNKSCVHSYRPISNQLLLSKIFENMVNRAFRSHICQWRTTLFFSQEIEHYEFPVLQRLYLVFFRRLCTSMYILFIRTFTRHLILCLMNCYFWRYVIIGIIFSAIKIPYHR